MGEGTTYYAIVNEFSSRERPFGVIRRVKQDGGRRDEVFSRDLIWKHTALLYSAERGDLTNDMVPISAEEAGRIVARIRELATERVESAGSVRDDAGDLLPWWLWAA